MYKRYSYNERVCQISLEGFQIPIKSFLFENRDLFVNSVITLFHLDVNVGGTLDSVSTLLQYWVNPTLKTLVIKEVVISLSIKQSFASMVITIYHHTNLFCLIPQGLHKSALLVGQIRHCPPFSVAPHLEHIRSVFCDSGTGNIQ